MQVLLVFLLAAALSGQAPEDVHFYGGTIIAIQKDKHRFLVVADSRSHHGKGSYFDDACKIVALGDKGFFVANGHTIISDYSSGTRKISFAIGEVAGRVFDNFRGLPNDEARLNKIAIEIGNRYINFHRVLPIPPDVQESSGNMMHAFIGGTLNDGSLVTYTLDVNVEPRGGTRPQLVATVKRKDIAVGDVLASGDDDAKADVYEFWQGQTARAKVANDQLQKQLATGPNADPDVLKLMAAVQAAIEWAKDKSHVGGPLDVLELKRGGPVHWIQRKPGCH